MLGICDRNVRVSTKCECAFVMYDYRGNSTLKKIDQSIYQLSKVQSDYLLCKFFLMQFKCKSPLIMGLRQRKSKPKRLGAIIY